MHFRITSEEYQEINCSGYLLRGLSQNSVDEGKNGWEVFTVSLVKHLNLCPYFYFYYRFLLLDFYLQRSWVIKNLFPTD